MYLLCDYCQSVARVCSVSDVKGETLYGNTLCFDGNSLIESYKIAKKTFYTFVY